MTTMTHEGYLATLEFDDQVGVFHGRVVNTRAVLTFEGVSTDELRAAFADTIADYVDWCAERGVEPEKPYSGTLSLRITPDLHRRVAEQAAKVGESINQFIIRRLEAIPREVAPVRHARNPEVEDGLIIKTGGSLYGMVYGSFGSGTLPSSTDVLVRASPVLGTSESSVVGVVVKTTKTTHQNVKDVPQEAKTKRREPTGSAKR
jgi:predicted HicB family RNase H-like nuclease